jgi:hypothetical protein
MGRTDMTVVPLFMIPEVAVFVNNASFIIHHKMFYLYVLVVYEVRGLHCDTV